MGAHHGVKTCRSSKGCRECGGRHHTALCHKISESKSENEKKTTMSVTTKDFSGNILPTALINLDSEGKITTNSLFDICSQKSFIVKSLAKKLNLEKIGEKILALDGFGSAGERKQYEIFRLPIYTKDERIDISVIMVDSLPERIFMDGRSRAVKKLKEINLNLADPNEKTDNYSDLSVLIGVDNYFKFVYAQNIIDDLYALPSKLGTLIAGNVSPNSPVSVNTVSTVLEISADNKLENIQKIWELDAVGIDVAHEELENDSVMNEFKNTLEFKEGKYIASLPWKISPKILPNNYNLAKTRLEQNLKKIEERRKKNLNVMMA